MTTDPRVIAARLGIDEPTVRQLQARGYLLRLDATDAEIRERLLVAHVRALSLHDVSDTEPSCSGPRPTGSRPTRTGGIAACPVQGHSASRPSRHA
jgi:hypothetical protein